MTLCFEACCFSSFPRKMSGVSPDFLYITHWTGGRSDGRRRCSSTGTANSWRSRNIFGESLGVGLFIGWRRVMAHSWECPEDDVPLQKTVDRLFDLWRNKKGHAMELMEMIHYNIFNLRTSKKCTFLLLELLKKQIVPLIYHRNPLFWEVLAMETYTS